MNKFLILALLTVTAFGQTFLFNGYKSKNVEGSLVGVPVMDPQGWYMGLPFKGVNTNGTFNFGLSTNNEPTAPTVMLSLTRMSFNQDTTATTTNKILFGTHSLRYAHPDYNFQRTELVSGTNTVYAVLSDYVYRKDSNLVAIVLPSLYGTNGISSLKAYSCKVVNTSTNEYQPTLGNWLTIPFDLQTNNTQTVRLWAVHALSAWAGQPCRVIQVITTDATHSLTNWITNMVADPYYVNRGGMTGTCYKVDIDVSSLSLGTYTNNFVAYPWEGDSGAVLDTRLGPTGIFTPLPAPQQFSKIDNTVTRYAALLDPLGVDLIGTVGTLATFNQSTALPFLTTAGALDAIRVQMNGAIGTNNVRACVLFANDGSYNLAGKTIASWAEPDCYVTITRSINSSTAENVNFNSATTTSGQFNYGKVKFFDVATIGANNTLLNNIDNVYFTQCIISNSASPFAHNGNGIHGTAIGTWYVEKCDVLKLTQGFKPLSQENFTCAIVVGNSITNVVVQTIPYTYCFNHKTGQSASGVLITPLAASSRAPQNDGFIFVGNGLFQMNPNGGIRTYGGDLTNRIGGVWALNIVEGTIGASAGGLSSMLGSVNTSDFGDCLNIHRLNETYVGQRCNDYFNWETSAIFNPFRKFGATINCVIHFSATKQDDFTTGNGRRTNNWSQMYGVMYRGSILGNPNAQDFTNQFPGIKCYQHRLGAGTSWQPYIGFTTMGAADPYETAGTSTGNGNYKPTAGSPAAHQAYHQIFTNDIYGAPITGDSSGAVTYP